MAQMFVLLLAVVTALCNLTLNYNTNSEFWVSILSLSLGSILPNPNYKKRYDVNVTPTFDSRVSGKEEA